MREKNRGFTPIELIIAIVSQAADTMPTRTSDFTGC